VAAFLEDWPSIAKVARFFQLGDIGFNRFRIVGVADVVDSLHLVHHAGFEIPPESGFVLPGVLSDAFRVPVLRFLNALDSCAADASNHFHLLELADDMRLSGGLDGPTMA